MPFPEGGPFPPAGAIPGIYTPTTVFGRVAADRLQPWLTDDLARYCDVFGAMFDETWTLVMDQSVDGQSDYVPGYGVLFDVDLCPARWLPVLGQIVGVPVPAGISEADARQLIKDESAIHRGTAKAIRRAVAATMTPFTFTATTTAGSAVLTAVSATAGVFADSTLLAAPGVPAGAVTASVSGATITMTDQDGRPARATASTVGVTVSAKTVRIVERVNHQGYAAAVITDPAYTPDLAAALAAAVTQKPAGIFPFTQYVSAAPLLMEYTRPLSAITATLGTATLADVV